ncbi:MAG: RimK family alpha-L-glutamate ligase [Oscillospiraceae bacterium]|nr:RimK family alpha-L-glutamate ligase [Oscillospiraceae bacterium]
MKGALIVNGFLNTEKFRDIYSRLENAFSKREVSLSLYANSELIAPMGEKLPFRDTPDFVLFWDKDVSLAKQIENENIPTFNSSSAIELCDDKAKTTLALHGFPMPKTIIAPKTFPNIGYCDLDFLDDVVSSLGFPIVVKECFGSFGTGVFLANDMDELLKIVREHEREPLLFQELIGESFGRDIRVNVVGGKVCAAMLRESKNGDFRSNITLGGDMKVYTPTKKEADLAISACEKLGLAFGGVDILFGKNGPLICEVNSNAHFKSTYDCTGINLADFIAEHIIKQMLCICHYSLHCHSEA